MSERLSASKSARTLALVAVADCAEQLPSASHALTVEVELADAAAAPRPERAVGLQGNGVIASRGHRRPVCRRADLHRARAPEGHGAVAQLAIKVAPPRPERAVGLQRNSVTAARSGRRPVRRRADLRRARAICGGAVAQLAIKVVPPRPKCAVGLKRTGVNSARSHSRQAGFCFEMNRARAICGRAVAHLSIKVVAPRPERAVNLQRNG